MSSEGSIREIKNQRGDPPSLLKIKLIEVRQNSSSKTILYCPPIVGTLPKAEVMRVLNAHAIYAVDVQKYGYSDFHQYVLQLQQQLSVLPDFDPKDFTVIGFSEGTALAARLGKAMSIPRKDVFLLAPVTSFRPSFDRIRIWMNQRQFKQQAELSYLKRLYSSKDKLYSSNGSLSRIDQIRILNRTRSQWRSMSEDLTHGIVVTGNRDYVSPPGPHADVSIDALHRLEEFMPYLKEATK